MIHVFGSVNLDLIVRVPRLPREGETVLGPAYNALPGGKGANQALAAGRGGADVALSACVGDDAFAAPALTELERAGVDLADLRRGHEPTGCAFVTVDEAGRNQIVVAAGANAALRADDAALAVLARAGTLLLQMEVPAAQSIAMAAAARRRGVRVLMNLAPAAPLAADDMAVLDWLLLNEEEALTTASGAGLPAPDARAAAQALASRIGCGVVLTLGASGAVAFHEGARLQTPARETAVVDTTGAGDAFAGYFAAALDAGLPPAVALQRAVMAGSLACTTAGAQTGLPYVTAVDAALAGSDRESRRVRR